MSYILDALKKSEQERSGLAAEHQANTSWLVASETKKAASLIPGLVMGIIISATLVFVGWYLLPEREEPRPVSTKNNEVTALKAEIGNRKNVSQPEARPEAQIGISALEKNGKPESVNGTAQEKKSLSSSPDGASEQNSAGANNERVDRSEPTVRRAERVLPPLNVLRTVPDLIITGHIYSSVATKRSVSMNGRDWNEGDYITDTIRLKEITENGIVVDVDGWDLPVRRNRGWQAIQ